MPSYMTSVQFHLMKLETLYIYFKLGVFQFPKEFLYGQFHSLDIKKAFYDSQNVQGQTPTFGTTFRDDSCICTHINTSCFFFLQGLKNVTVIEGESVTLECHISGYPSPKVTWYREDYQIESSIDFQITFQSGIARLLIREAFAEDSGRFTCTAVNEAGTVSTSCYLAVQGQWSHPHGPSTHSSLPPGTSFYMSGNGAPFQN